MQQESHRDGSISFLVQEVARLLRRRFEDEARLHGFTLPQWRALAEISRSAGLSQVSLAAAIDADQMTVSGILSRLEKRDLIERYSDPNDSRAKLARLTPAGHELVVRARHVGRGLYERALAGLDAAERERLAANLRHIRDTLNAMTDAKELA
jgi:DNA-binding MarR family transcriptional regulator